MESFHLQPCYLNAAGSVWRALTQTKQPTVALLVPKNSMRAARIMCLLGCLLPALLLAAGNASAVILDEEDTFTLNNGIIAAQAAKSSGDLTSLKYRGLELLSTS